MSNEIGIDLNDARTSRESRVLSGRPRGVECRQRFNLSKLDVAPERVVVTIPADIYSMNISFFLGLFGDSVRALGKVKFMEKYRFICDPIHTDTILDGIERALKESDIFSGRKAKLAS